MIATVTRTASGAGLVTCPTGNSIHEIIDISSGIEDDQHTSSTKVTVKIFDDSMGALLMLDGQLSVAILGMRMAAVDAIQKFMELILGDESYR